MTPKVKMRWHLFCAVLAGLALRLFFLHLPVSDAGDTQFYQELAANWLDHRVYGLYLNGVLVPTDMRVPGYPALLAAIYALFGRSQLATMLTQAAIDLLSCFLVAILAARLAPEKRRPRVFLAALWLSVLCPFTTNYTSVVLTEVLAVFLTAAALVLFTAPGSLSSLPEIDHRQRVNRSCFLGGLVTGLGTLVRPETPLLLLAIGLVLAARCWNPRYWKLLLRCAALMAVGLVLPLLPWAARNWVTLHRLQFLAPKYAELPGEHRPVGFDTWTATWLWRFRDVYLVPWKLENEPINFDDIPSYAFDSARERERVASLFEIYNDSTTLTPQLDARFAEIARERTRGHPLRTYFSVPGKRALAMWFTPRVELLPYSGHILPLAVEWDEDRTDLLVSSSLGLLNIVYVVAALFGICLLRRNRALLFLLAFVVVRTAFVTTAETPEPRYVLECFPVVLALATQVFATREAATKGRWEPQLSSKGSG